MKKITRKISLRRESIRLLVGRELTAAGGQPTVNDPPGSIGSACWTACNTQSCTFAPNNTCGGTCGTCNGCTLITF